MDISIINDVVNLYFNEHLKVKDIALVVKVSEPSVSRIIKTDARYIDEKEQRKYNSKQKHTRETVKYIKATREQRKIDEAYYVLEEQHKQASFELSKNKHLSNESYRNWNTSAYSYDDRKKCFEFRDNLGRAADVPKYVKVKI